MQPLISLIIPVYNVEKYFRKCMGSVLAQTYENFEVILVDDGSTDGSGGMCDEYAAKDDRVRAYHKPNGGLSDARNYGVSKAKGEYVAFVDSDDYIAREYLADMGDMVVRFHADCAIVGVQQVFSDMPAIDRERGDLKHEILSAEDVLKLMLYDRKTTVSACSKLFRKEQLILHPFPLGKLYEDLLAVPRIISECKIVVISDAVDYFYVQREGSILHTYPGKKELEGIDSSEEILKFIESKHPSVVPAARSRCAIKILAFVCWLMSGSREDKEIFAMLRTRLKKYWIPVVMDPEASRNLKIKCTAVMLGYGPARLLWKLIDRAKGRALVE